MISKNKRRILNNQIELDKGIDKNEFLKIFLPIIKIYFQSSESSRPEDVTELFNKVEDLYRSYK